MFLLFKYCSTVLGISCSSKGLFVGTALFTVAAFSAVRRTPAVPLRSHMFWPSIMGCALSAQLAHTWTCTRCAGCTKNSSFLSNSGFTPLSFQMSTRKQCRQPLLNIKKGKWQSPCPQNDVHWWCKHQWMPTHLQVSISLFLWEFWKWFFVLLWTANLSA